MELLATKLALFPFKQREKSESHTLPERQQGSRVLPFEKGVGGGEKERKYYQIKQIDLALSF